MTTSFMEHALANGFVAAQVTRLIKDAGRDAKLFSVTPIAYRGSNRRTLRVVYNPRAELLFEYPIPERETMESKALWESRVKAEVVEAWRASDFGKRIEAASASPTSRPGASSTDAPPASEKSLSAPERARIRSALGLQSSPQSTPTETFSPDSSDPSLSTASSSLFSSGTLAGDSTSGTVPHESTSQSDSAENPSPPSSATSTKPPRKSRASTST